VKAHLAQIPGGLTEANGRRNLKIGCCGFQKPTGFFITDSCRDVRKGVSMSNRAMIGLDGGVAGLIGAAIVAIWFLFMDAVTRLPLYTPTVLGEGLLFREHGLASNAVEQASLKLTLMYSGVHGLIFMVLGVIAAYLLLLPKRKLHLGVMLIALFAVLELGFIGTAFIVAKPVLDELAWPIVLTGNFLAAAGMACYLSLLLRSSNVGLGGP